MRVMTPRESSFVRCAAAVVKRIQEEPIETKSRTQFRFVSDGYQEEEFRFRDYYGTIVRLREKLTALPEVIHCITLLSQERNRIREYKLSDDAGAAVTVNETNIRPWVADDLWRIIGKGLDRHQSERVATRQYLSWFRTVIRHSESPPPRRRIVPVFGLSMNQTLRFGSAVLSPFSAQEKSDLLSGPAARSIDPLVLMGAQAKIESTKAMMISLITPLLAVVIGAVVLGEKLPPQTFVGGLLIIGSIGLIVFRRRVRKTKEELITDGHG